MCPLSFFASYGIRIGLRSTHVFTGKVTECDHSQCTTRYKQGAIYQNEDRDVGQENTIKPRVLNC